MDRAVAHTPVERTAQRFEFQAVACAALGSSLYAGLLNHTARDLRSSGPAVDVLDGYLEAPGRSALALRMLGGVHALVLTGRAPELARFYPSVGGRGDPGPDAALAWPALREVLIEQAEEVRAWLDHPPQTNEVGRGAALVGALCHLTSQASYPIRLIEIGASAGLNLRADKFRITGGGAAYGLPSSPVQMPDGWRGQPPVEAPIQVVSRVGGDLKPVDPVSESGRLKLLAYVWADQVERLARLRGACQLAAEIPAEMRTEPASETVSRSTLEPGTWTVLWHSIMRQYLSPEQKEAIDAGIEALGGQATNSARFAHVSLELVRGTTDTPVELITWPGRVTRRLGAAPPHGLPVTWSG